MHLHEVGEGLSTVGGNHVGTNCIFTDEPLFGSGPKACLPCLASYGILKTSMARASVRAIFQEKSIRGDHTFPNTSVAKTTVPTTLRTKTTETARFGEHPVSYDPFRHTPPTSLPSHQEGSQNVVAELNAFLVLLAQYPRQRAHEGMVLSVCGRNIPGTTRGLKFPVLWHSNFSHLFRCGHLSHVLLQVRFEKRNFLGL